MSLPRRRDTPRRTTHPVQPPGKLLPVAPSMPESLPRGGAREQVWRRARGLCQISSLTGCRAIGTDYHHRQPQGRVDTPDNLVLVCNPCHIHRIHGYPEWARIVGLLIPRHRPLPDTPWRYESWMPPHPTL